MSNPRHCPDCGSDISPDAPEGLCRKCLMRLGLHEPRGLHLRCPHCHNPMELVDDRPLDDIECPSCGSHFSMVSAETATMSGLTTKRIGHYELVEQVGMGHFGSVWKAKDTELDRVVAVKIPRKGQLDAAETDQFLREARAAAQIKHPNIVSVHEVGHDGDSVYIVSDFVEGASLSEWLTGRRLTPIEAAQLCAKIAYALHAAHESGVIHRDLKPANIMVDQHGEPYLTDFGLAKREAGEVTVTLDGRIWARRPTCHPSRHEAKPMRQMDGAMFIRWASYYSSLLTNELPFRGESRMLIVQILQEDPPSPRKLNARVRA